MIRFLLGVLILLALAAPAQAQRACDQFTAFEHINATGPVEIVPANPSQRIYLCGFSIIQKGNTLDFTILLGHGTNCDTDTITLATLQFPNDVAFNNRIQTVGPTSDYG